MRKLPRREVTARTLLSLPPPRCENQSTPHWMSLGVEDDFIEIKSSGRHEQQIEILERFGKDEALHRISFLFGNHALERRVTDIVATVFDEVAPHRLAHAKIFWIVREVVE